ncbi:hypothetical protein H6F43_04245 [Leptolyngbya sp. FACHB-36]|uniref:hypothetical protein n=1 Tax=Leptolyngbya sp. FACHB-36 TaxID=2692808 RepID=UPI0016812958|nr:hypothetical protein [Leptolyngbya sp. FACHB-36]MBD2019394.1 hypothetical protein [Leptolyngbya sp. FACHB-36]
MSRQTRLDARTIEALLKHVEKRPGISEPELAVCLGLKPWTERAKKDKAPSKVPNRLLRDTLKQLAEEAVIQYKQDQFATQGEPFKVFPASYKLPQKKRRSPSDSCRTYTASSEKIRQLTAKTSTKIAPFRLLGKPVITEDENMKKKPEKENGYDLLERCKQKESGRRSPDSLKEAVRRAIQKMLDSGQPWTLGKVCSYAAVPEDYLHKNADMMQEFGRALSQIQKTLLLPEQLSQPAAKEAKTAPVKTEEIEQLQELEEVNRDLRTRLADAEARIQQLEQDLQEAARLQAKIRQLETVNESLRDRIGAIEGSSYCSDSQLIACLADEEIRYRLKVKQCTQEIEQLQEDVAVSQAVADVLRNLIERKQWDAIETIDEFSGGNHVKP